jgi:hypothetical protein
MCTETAAAAIPTSAGPISRATMNAEAKDSPPAAVASSPDQKTFPAIRRLSWVCFQPASHGGRRTREATGSLNANERKKQG